MSQASKTQLAAILFSDIVGYSSMMQRNRTKAVSTVSTYKKVLEHEVMAFNGEVLNDYGDGSLSIFNSATDAVRCAMAMQQQFQSEPIVPLRIGIHIGEIHFENGKPFGDGVNIASRIESLGQVGTVFFSKNVYDKVKNLPEFEIARLGQFEFKNIEEAFTVYALANEGFPIPKAESLTGKLKLEDTSSKYISKTWLLPPLLVALLILSGILVWNQWAFESQSEPGQVADSLDNIDKSIAVLPFRDLSPEGNQEYFSDGIAEEILNALASLEDLKVVGRSSSFSFKGKGVSIPEIGKQLNVSTILEGSVRKMEDRVRITAQLINTVEDRQLWSKSYDRKLDDIFAIQNEIALSIADKLKVSLLEDQQKNIINKKTENQEAYDLYLKGMSIIYEYSESMQDAIDYFLQALELDFQYSDAFVGLAYAKAWLAWGQLVEPKEAFSQSLQVLELAHVIDPESKPARSLKFAINNWHQWDWEKMQEDIDQNIPEEYRLANYYSFIGQHEKAIFFSEKSLKKDPLNLIYHNNLVNNLIRARRLEEALEKALIQVELFPQTGRVFFNLGNVYSLMGRYQKALEAFDKAYVLSDNKIVSDIRIKGYSIRCLVNLGRKTEANKIMGQLLQAKESSFVDPRLLMDAFISLDKKEKALNYLELGYHARSIGMIDIKVHPRFDPLRQEPRFQAILEKMNFRRR